MYMKASKSSRISSFKKLIKHPSVVWNLIKFFILMQNAFVNLLGSEFK